MPPDIRPTSELYWWSALLAALIDVPFVAILTWRIGREQFRQLKWPLALAALGFWSGLWSWAMASEFGACFLRGFPFVGPQSEAAEASRRTDIVARHSQWSSLASLFPGRRRSAGRRMPHLDLWRRMLAERRPRREAARLAARIQACYDELRVADCRPKSDHPMLLRQLDARILPGLAVYLVLREAESDSPNLRAEVERMFAAAFARSDTVMPLLHRLTDPFDVFRAACRRVLSRDYPPEGWEIRWIEGDDQAFAYEVHRCFYLDVLRAYRVPELTPLFCTVDDALFSALPSSIVWQRETTLALGGARCDFGMSRAHSTQPGTDHSTDDGGRTE